MKQRQKPTGKRDRHLSKDYGECNDVKLSQKLPNLAKPNTSPEQNVKSLRISQSAKPVHETYSIGKHVLSTHSDPVTGPGFSDANQHSTPDAVMEENVRMRKAINDAVLALTRKIHTPSEQTENVFLLFNMLKESERKQKKQQRNLEDMANKMKARESEWAAERLIFEEKEQVSKQMILTLQEENYKLRKSRSFVFSPRRQLN